MAENKAVIEAEQEHEKEKDFAIVVNGEPKTIETEVITYEKVVKLAYPIPPSPDTRFTVTFRNAKKPKEGSLAPDGSVDVKKEGTIFNVKATGKS